ncbi:hypothetical protein TRL7639_00434 [Falsiruegeria litorea R37]|uniref:Uncharacterized protein n=1 Tax=Falsiruegeria litorea R37 TaxID=1200284 RepID=A0A1Y5RLV6_9RHOB|nr:hypothetical protein TRL7639_00434 [Falsiruegeria litorea R37]
MKECDLVMYRGATSAEAIATLVKYRGQTSYGQADNSGFDQVSELSKELANFATLRRCHTIV